MSITTIIPVFNAEPYLGEVLESVLAQTRPCDEIIVVDDCSTDGSRTVASRYPVRLLSTPRNSGPAATRKVAIKEAKGDILAWIDADDIWETNHLETVLGLLDRHPEADVAFTAVRCFGTCDRLWLHEECGDVPREIFWECFRRTVPPAMSAVTRTAPVRAIDGFDASIPIAPDFDFWLRLSRNSRFVWTNDLTARYRWHASQFSSRRPFDQRASQVASRFRMWSTLVAEGDQASADQAADIIRQLWDEELTEAWSQNDRGRLKAWLGLQNYIPDGTELGRTLARRVLIPMWPSPLWDKTRQVVRSVVGR